MIRQFAKNYSEIIALAFLYTVVLCIVSPLDVTQYNIGDKSAGFLYEAVSFNIAGRSPLYSFLGWIVTRLPISDALSMSLFLSIIPAIAAVILVYIIVKKETNNRFYAIVGSLTLMSSSIYFLQAQKIEPYCLASSVFLLGYFFALQQRNTVSAFFLGISVVAHPVMLFLIAVIAICNKNLRSKIFIILTIPALVFSIIGVQGIANASGVFIWQNSWSFFGERELYLLFSSIFVFSFGIIPVIALMIERRDIYFIFGLFILTIYFVVLAITATPGINHIALALPMFSVLSGIGMQHMRYRWNKMILFGCILMFAISILFFDVRINDNIDGSTSARLIIKDLTDVKNNSVIYSYKMYKSRPIQDGYFVIDVVKYCNYKFHKNLSTISSSEDSDYYFEIVDVKKNYSQLVKNN